MANEELLQQTYASRDRYAASLGTVNPDVLAPLINPTFMGGPSWPDLRQAWRVVRRGRGTIVMSDGLADPFSDEPDKNSGFELEVLAETSDELPDPVQASWLFDLAYQVSQQCAYHGGVRALIDRLGLISLELPMSVVLEPVATSNDTAGVLLGITPPDFPQEFEGPCGIVRIVTAKLLWPSELDYAAAEGKLGREELAKRFAADGTHHRSSLLRRPVV
ncbi:MAG: hypothetical protein R3B84_23105 [Zavarzinella sp.]